MDTSHQLVPGAVFARDFRVVRALAEGGMGAVYVVEQLSTQRLRALKVMLPQVARDPKFRERFVQEAVISGRIQSDHVVEVIGAGIDEPTGTPWLCMELLEGQDLESLMARRGRLSPAEVLEVFRQLCHGLGAAHRAGLVHRDLKPANVFMAAPRREGALFTVKILDFGIAKVLEESKTSAQATATIGSPLWMAPEQADQGTIRPATDVWALGLIAFHLLTGRYYWRAGNAQSPSLPTLMREVYVDQIEPASYRAASYGCAETLPPNFDGWFVHCVNRDPGQRFRDATEALAALAPLLGGVGVATYPQPGAPSFTPPHSNTPYPANTFAPPPSPPTPPPGAFTPYGGNLAGYTQSVQPSAPNPYAPSAPSAPQPRSSIGPVVVALAIMGGVVVLGAVAAVAVVLRKAPEPASSADGGAPRTSLLPSLTPQVPQYRMPECRDRAQRADIPGLLGIAQVSAGMMHSCAVSRDGTARCWGMNAQRQLGDGTTEDHYAPHLVPTLAGITQLAAGQTFSCALRVDGTVWCWGILERQHEQPYQVPSLLGINQVTAGSMHACALRVDGTVWCWGQNSNGQLGEGTTSYRQTPRQVVGLTNVAQIDAGGSHTCALVRDGSVWCWGGQEYGQLGDGRHPREGRPTPAPVPGVARATQVTAGDKHSCARLADGTLRCWGGNEEGQLGDGTEINRPSPVAVRGVAGVAEVAAGQSHTCARLVDGSLWCWGQNYGCQSGSGAYAAHRAPSALPGVAGVTSLAVGGMHTCVALRSGAARCWGLNTYGQVGNGATSSRPDLTTNP